MVNEKIISPLFPLPQAPPSLSFLFPSFLPNCSNPKPQFQLYLSPRLSLSRLYQTSRPKSIIFSLAHPSLFSFLLRPPAFREVFDSFGNSLFLENFSTSEWWKGYQ